MLKANDMAGIRALLAQCVLLNGGVRLHPYHK